MLIKPGCSKVFTLQPVSSPFGLVVSARNPGLPAKHHLIYADFAIYQSHRSPHRIPTTTSREVPTGLGR